MYIYIHTYIYTPGNLPPERREALTEASLWASEAHSLSLGQKVQF